MDRYHEARDILDSVRMQSKSGFMTSEKVVVKLVIDNCKIGICLARGHEEMTNEFTLIKQKYEKILEDLFKSEPVKKERTEAQKERRRKQKDRARARKMM